jgi:hypothetical protein
MHWIWLIAILALIIVLLRRDAKCADPAVNDANYDFGSSFLLGSDIIGKTADEIIAKRNAGPPVQINLAGPTLDLTKVEPTKPYFVGKRVKSRTLQPASFGGKVCEEWPELIFKLNSDCVEFFQAHSDFVRDRAAGMNEAALIQKYGISLYLLAQNSKC